MLEEDVQIAYAIYRYIDKAMSEAEYENNEYSCGNKAWPFIPRRRNWYTRLGRLNPESPKAKGDKFEELTGLWRKVKNLNIETKKKIWSFNWILCR